MTEYTMVIECVTLKARVTDNTHEGVEILEYSGPNFHHKGELLSKNWQEVYTFLQKMVLADLASKSIFGEN